IEHYLGPDAFRAGVRLYMRRHREGNTVAADLWRALEEASGKPVARVAQAWIAQPGFPLVSIAPARDGGPAALGVHQERFFADPRAPAARSSPSSRSPTRSARRPTTTCSTASPGRST